LHPLWLGLLVWLWAAVAAGGAEPPAPPPPADVPRTREAIEQNIQRLKAAEGLAEEVRDAALKLCQDALPQLEAAAEQAAKAKEFDALRAGAPERLAEMEAALKTLTAAPEFEPPEGLSLEAAQLQFDKARADLNAATQQLTAVQADATQRQELRKKLPEDSRAAKDQVEKLQGQLAALAARKDPPEVALARAASIHAQLAAAQAKAARLEAELSSYEARDKLLQLRLDLPAAEQRMAKQRIDKLQALVEELRRDEAERAQAQAEAELEAAADAHEVVREQAAVNLDLSNERAGPRGLVAKLEAINRKIDAASERLGRIKAERQSILDRIKVAGMTKTIGLLLRKQRAELPRLRQLRRNVRLRQGTMAAVELRLIELREERGSLLSVDEELRQRMESLEPPLEGSARERVEARLRNLLTQQRQILQALTEDTSAYFEKLFDLDLLERQLIDETEAFNALIDEHVLWIRSAAPLDWSDAAQAGGALAWLFGRRARAAVAQCFGEDLAGVPVLYAIALLVLLAALVARHVLRRRLEHLADRVADPRGDRFSFTVRALVCTAVIALPGPAVLWFASWRVGATEPGDGLLRAVATALYQVAWVFLPLEFFRQVCRPRGLGEAHFRWPRPALAAARRTLSLWLLIVLPLVFVVLALERHDNEAYKASLGRLAFLVATGLTGALTYRLLRVESAVFAASRKDAGAGILLRTQWLWFPVLAGAPLLLGVAAALGYAFTAVQLFARLLATFLLVLGLLTVQAVVHRWLFVVRRRLALEERRRRQQEAAEKERTEAGAAAPAAEPAISLADLREQTRTLVRWVIGLSGVLGLYLIWVDVLPALAILHRARLWGDPSGEGALQVTLADLLLAGGVVVLALMAAKNLPGVLAVTLLQRLPLDAGARYAVTAIVRYAITLVGLLVATSVLGLRWSSVQWLLAALTVGLGFGLQEIFANFVSGMILLFERPIRVGDTVTIGDVSGTVTRIRIRATTITDWDRKELIVPNKEFITGRLINWTLSDEIVRVRIPVGIAYGSDTARAYDVLLQTARTTPDVLDEPAPQALFLDFGDSSLNFELRVFVRGLGPYLKVIHALHMGVDQAFREAGIEIAFPQRDVHIRSIDTVVPFTQERRDG
jgi:potassium efflux system protein